MKTVDEIFQEMLSCFGEQTGVELEPEIRLLGCTWEEP